MLSRKAIRRRLPAISATFVTILFVAFGQPTSAAQHMRQITLAYPGPEYTIWTQLAENLVRSNPDLPYSPLPLSLLGGAHLALTALQYDRVDIAVINNVLFARKVRSFDLLNLPLLIRNIKEGRLVLRAARAVLDDAARLADLKILGYTWSIGTFVSTHNCVRRLEDLRDQEILGGPPLYQKLFAQVGATPVIVRSSEIIPALLSGYANKGFFSVEFIAHTKLNEFTECFTDPSEFAPMMVPYVIVTNIQNWETMSLDTRTHIQRDIGQLEHQADRFMTDKVAEVAHTFDERASGSVLFNPNIVRGWREHIESLYRDFGATTPYGASLLDLARTALP